MSPLGCRDQAVASEPPTGGHGRLHLRPFLLLALIFTLTGGTATAGAQETPKQPPAAHSHTSDSHTSPAPVETPAPAPADEHSDHDTKATPKAPAAEHSRGLVLGGFAALNASILLAAAGVRRRDPKRQRRARANTLG